MSAIGIDIGKTRIKRVVVDPAGVVLDHDEVATPEDAGVIEVVKTMAHKSTGPRQDRAIRIGLSAPGVASRDHTQIAHLPGGQPTIEGVDWTRELGWPTFVPILNDAKAALLAEARFGAAKGCQQVILLTLGTGVGGAVMIDGRLLHGRTGKAGHLGHISLHPDWPKSILGMPGSLEYAFGDWSVKERSGGRFASTRALVEAQQAGDALAHEVWREAIGHLARGIGSLLNVLDPQVVVIGGGVTKAGDALFGPLREQVAAIEWCPTGGHVPIVSAGLGAEAGAIGAACFAAQRAKEVDA